MPNCLTLKKSNCKNCYKCNRHCPVKAIRFSGNQAHIIGNECILCGQCFVVCPQNAKQIVDETEKVRVLLQSGDPVVVSLAPSFVANYDGVGINAMRDALQKLGFYDVEETAIGATIVKNEYERMLKEDGRDVIITSCCHSVNLLIQKYFPAELEYLADVMSPMQAHCQDIKKRFPNAKTVFIATGMKRSSLNIKGLKELEGSGVSYCAVCDGAFYKDKTVAVIGGGNTAVDDALLLSDIAQKVYLIHRRDVFRGEESLVNRIRTKENVDLLLNRIPTAAGMLTKIGLLKQAPINTLKISIFSTLALRPMFLSI